MIRNISIKNYKSVQEACLLDCSRYNLLIGRPNVGKSNILEALSLFQGPYFTGWKVDFNKVFRVENASSLFYLGDVERKIEVDTKNSSLFTSLFMFLKEAPTIKTMSMTLDYLLENKFSADTAILCNIIK